MTDKSPRELSIQVTSFVGTHKHRELSDIGIKVNHSKMRMHHVNWPHANLVYQATYVYPSWYVQFVHCQKGSSSIINANLDSKKESLVCSIQSLGLK